MGFRSQLSGPRLEAVDLEAKTMVWRESSRLIDRRVALRAFRALVTSRFFESLALWVGCSRVGAENVAYEVGRVS